MYHPACLLLRTLLVRSSIPAYPSPSDGPTDTQPLVPCYLTFFSVLSCCRHYHNHLEGVIAEWYRSRGTRFIAMVPRQAVPELLGHPALPTDTMASPQGYAHLGTRVII